MDADTKRFLYKAMGLTVCLTAAGIVLAQLIAVFYFGDGEGLRIADSLRPLAMEIIGGMIVALGLTRLMDTKETISGQSAAPAAAAADSTSTAPAAASVPSVASLIGQA